MKKIYYTLFAAVNLIVCQAQNSINGPMGVYGPQYNAATTLLNGGNALVGAGGNWYLGGNVTSADKGNPNSPGAAGRSEAILFSGSGTYSNASSSNFIDGYAGVVSPVSSFVLPIGTTNASSFYAPVTVPANGNTFTAAYFSGSGAALSTLISGKTVTVFSPYIDVVTTGANAGAYTLTYPPGFASLGHDYLLGSVDGGTSYTVLAPVSPYNVAGGTVNPSSIAVPSGSSRIAFATTTMVLSFKLLSLNAVPAANSAILLNWVTGTEANNRGFYIERSADAGISWSNLGFVSTKAAGGNSNAILSYKFNDPSPVNGINYYRLRQTDIDGKTTLSYIVSAMISGTGVKIYPNPVNNVLQVTGANPDARFTITGMLGQTLITSTNIRAINVSALLPGNYCLQILSAGKIQTIQFEKK